MTPSDFDTWFAYHAAAFTGIHAWLGKIPSGERGQTLTRWRTVLDGIDLDEAKAASDRLFDGSESKPFGYDGHPASIAAIARRHRPTAEASRPMYVDGQETFRCATCKDMGVFHVWHPRSMAVARTEPEKLGNHFTLYSTIVRCGDCSGLRKWSFLPRFDAKRSLRILGSMSDVEEQERLVAFMQTVKPPGYHDEFGRYGG